MSRRGLSQRSSRQKLLAPRAVAEVPVVLAILTLGIVSTSRRRPRSVSPEKEKLDDKAPNGNTRRVARRWRNALLAAENELTRWSDELAHRRQELPWARLDKEYAFDTDDGSASLADLFRGRSNCSSTTPCSGPDYTAGFLACSAVADG